jgi:DeoR/GlpR family transcriptional regulator of sugar metabolism
MLLGNISEIDILVTNFQPPSEIIEICKSNKIEIIVSSPLDDENLNQNLE